MFQIGDWRVLIAYLGLLSDLLGKALLGKGGVRLKLHGLTPVAAFLRRYATGKADRAEAARGGRVRAAAGRREFSTCRQRSGASRKSTVGVARRPAAGRARLPGCAAHS